MRCPKNEAGKKPIDGLLWIFYDLAQSFRV